MEDAEEREAFRRGFATACERRGVEPASAAAAMEKSAEGNWWDVPGKILGAGADAALGVGVGAVGAAALGGEVLGRAAAASKQPSVDQLLTSPTDPLVATARRRERIDAYRAAARRLEAHNLMLRRREES